MEAAYSILHESPGSVRPPHRRGSHQARPGEVDQSKIPYKTVSGGIQVGIQQSRRDENQTQIRQRLPTYKSPTGALERITVSEGAYPALSACAGSVRGPGHA